DPEAWAQAGPDHDGSADHQPDEDEEVMRPVEAPLAGKRPRVLSGFRPTGPMHIGHLVGALDNWIKLQDTHECYFAICDWHALTSEYADTSRLKEYVEEMAIDWRAVGLDPGKCT